MTTWATAPGSVEVPDGDGPAGDVPVQGRDAGADARHQLRRRPRWRRGRRSCTGTAASTSASRPAYSPNILTWVSAGGVYAVANLRGGNEEGEEWHRAGMLEQQAERLRRLPRRRRDADPGGLDHAGAAGHLRRVERRPAGRRGADPAARAVRRGHLLRAAAGHGAVRAVRAGADLERRVRHRGGSRAARLAAGLLAVPPRGAGDARTRRCCSPCSPATPGSTRCTRTRCARRCSTPLRRDSARPVLLRAEAQVGHGARAVSRMAGAGRGHAGVRRAAHRAQGLKVTLKRAPGSGRSRGGTRPRTRSGCRSRPGRPPG